MEAAYSSKMLVFYHHTTWHNNPENHILYLHHCENLQSPFYVAGFETCTIMEKMCGNGECLHREACKLPYTLKKILNNVDL
jgi:hypothetical protein